MWMVNRKARVEWLALIACAVLLLVSTGVSSSYAQSTGSPSKSAGSLEGEDGAAQGDPDGPTGEAPPPSGTSTSTSIDGVRANRGNLGSGGITAVEPGKRYGDWAQWRLALKLMARNFYYIR